VAVLLGGCTEGSLVLVVIVIADIVDGVGGCDDGSGWW
jgi:hypothetical protein